MKPKSIAIVGAAETTDMGRIANLSQIGLHADAARKCNLVHAGAMIRVDVVNTGGRDLYQRLTGLRSGSGDVFVLQCFRTTRFVDDNCFHE
jgi:hypothetical protein